MSKTLITKSFKETQQLGFDFAKKLQGGEVLALYGDLGSGKTTFIQGLAAGLGIDRPIISPSFIIMRTYELRLKSKDVRLKNFYHVDLYRINDANDVQGLGLLDLIGNSENIVAIEWPDKIENILPENKIAITFEYLEEDKRKIKIN